MHPIGNEIEVPTDQVEREFKKRARPGFTGQVRLTTRVRPDAAAAVEFIPEEREVQGSRAETRSPELFLDRPTEREMEVSAKIIQNRHKFRLGMQLTQIVGNFKDGHLNTIEFITVG
jgi:hypothetical protein